MSAIIGNNFSTVVAGEAIVLSKVSLHADIKHGEGLVVFKLIGITADGDKTTLVSEALIDTKDVYTFSLPMTPIISVYYEFVNSQNINSIDSIIIVTENSFPIVIT